MQKPAVITDGPARSDQKACVRGVNMMYRYLYLNISISWRSLAALYDQHLGAICCPGSHVRICCLSRQNDIHHGMNDLWLSCA